MANKFNKTRKKVSELIDTYILCENTCWGLAGEPYRLKYREQQSEKSIVWYIGPRDHSIELFKVYLDDHSKVRIEINSLHFDKKLLECLVDIMGNCKSWCGAKPGNSWLGSATVIRLKKPEDVTNMLEIIKVYEENRKRAVGTV